jgi:hypothetical protein
VAPFLCRVRDSLRVSFSPLSGDSNQYGAGAVKGREFEITICFVVEMPTMDDRSLEDEEDVEVDETLVHAEKFSG